MNGLMQEWPLLCHRIMEYAARQHGPRRVVSRAANGSLKVTNYSEIYSRSLRVSQSLLREGIVPGDRIATIAWSTSDHLECWYGIAGIGAVYHPINPRLFVEQIAFIINDAKDRIVFVDASFVTLAESLQDRIPSVERFVVLTDGEKLPESSLRGVIAYADWLAEVNADYAWPDFEEDLAAGLAYTSGTTGQPKGVLYSHRSIVLMSLAANSPDMYGFGSNDVVLQVVPMFHANGWTWPFSAPMAGAGLILPGAQMDGASLSQLMTEEKVTCTGGVPTVWQSVLTYLAEQGQSLTALKRLYIGGSPCPRFMMEAFRRFNVEVRSAFGMTEMGPMAAIGSHVPETALLTGETLSEMLQKQGRVPFLVEMQIYDDEDERLPWDGRTSGRLKARGPCVARRYLGAAHDSLDKKGFFDTGDIATIDQYGYVKITDRAKDLVKSGGEWISSIDLENFVMDHPEIHEAAVVGVIHPKWDERPIVIAVRKTGTVITKEALLEFLSSKIAKWWMPDDIVFVDSLPHTSTGKLNKKVLRAEYERHLVDAHQLRSGPEHEANIAATEGKANA
jgi:fatty-acyl-CoA synthase